MALMITLPSYCGRSSVRVDFYDYPDATEACCCNECHTISESRRAWEDYDYEDYMQEMWGMDGND